MLRALAPFIALGLVFYACTALLLTSEKRSNARFSDPLYEEMVELIAEANHRRPDLHEKLTDRLAELERLERDDPEAAEAYRRRTVRWLHLNLRVRSGR